MNTYSYCTSETYSFLIIDTNLPAGNLLRFILKMTLSNEIKILDNKIKANQIQ